MGEVWFYHLTDSPLEDTLPALLLRSLGRGMRVVVRGRDAARLKWLDERLWLHPKDGFLPHGLAGGPHDADQPVLLTTAPGRPNGARFVMAVDGCGIAPGELAEIERGFVLFDGNDPDALQAARDGWRTLTGAGARAVYWAEAGGRWEKRAESGA